MLLRRVLLLFNDGQSVAHDLAGNPGDSLPCLGVQLRASHTKTVRSSLADAMRLPSWLNTTPRTGPLCPLSTRTSCAVLVSQTRTVLSRLPEAETPTIRAERHAANCLGVPLESVRFLSGPYVPELDSAIVAGRSQSFAVGAEGHAFDNPLMPL